MAGRYILMSNQTTTAAGSSVQYCRRNSSAEFEAYGDFDGATAKLQFSPNNGTTWIDVTGASLTANGAKAVNIPYGQLIRADLSSTGASTNVTVVVNPYRVNT